MKLRRLLLPAIALALVACKENINTPGQCPELCPGEQIGVRDTVLMPVPASDTSFFGYLTRTNRKVLLVSNGLSAGEYRAFVGFPNRIVDSVTVDNLRYKLEVDTIAVGFELRYRDTTATDLTIYLHRLPLTTDTTITYDDLAAQLMTAEILDSIKVPDTLKSGLVEAIFAADELVKLETPEADSGKMTFGLTVRASKPTGVGLSVDASGTESAPTIQTRGRVEVGDTTKQRQAVTIRPTDLGRFGYVGSFDRKDGADPDLLYIGGPSGARSVIRFDIPSYIMDSTQILRATLELTPALPLEGLPDRVTGDTVGIRGVQVDLGAKSPTLVASGLTNGGGMKVGTTETVLIDLVRLATQWQRVNGPPSVVFLVHNEEAIGGGFMQPVFYSTRSPSGQPRLRITYGVKTQPGRP